MEITSFIVDAFTNVPFSGNPAAVCLLESPLADPVLQRVAAEFNLSETAFLQPLSPGRWQLRWFTPKVEVNLCGHATLAAAHALWHGCQVSDPLLRFETRSGELQASKQGDDIGLDFPARPPAPLDIDVDWQAVLGCIPLACHQAEEDWLVELDTEATIRALTPNLVLVEQLPVRGLMVTAVAAMPDADFVSRFFAPAAGVNEDPVTGSAHCMLAPYWAAKTGRNQLTGYQASARGGFVGVALQGSRVLLSGRAVTLLKGVLHVPS